MIFKKIQLSFGLILKIAGSIILLTVAGFFAYNQMMSILEKKNEINYNLLSNCVIDSAEDRAKTLADQKECFKRYKIDTRFVNFSEKVKRGGLTDRIIRDYYLSVDQQSENSQIQEWVIDYEKYLDERERVSRNSQIHDLLLVFVFIFLLVFVILVIRLTIRWLESRSQAKRKDIMRDHGEGAECQCDDCLKQKNKDMMAALRTKIQKSAKREI